jgi:hypothetical protein
VARIRSVHPGLFTDEAFVTCSAFARLLVIGLWTEADDQGVFEWKPVMIKMRLFPADNIDAAALLAELCVANLIARFQCAGKEYGAVRNFRRFQRPKKPNSIHPLPDEFRTYVALSGDSSEPTDDDAGQVPPKSELGPQMEDGGGRRKDVGKKSARADFDRFWKTYPHQVGEGEAFEAFRAVAGEIEAILDGLSRYVSTKPPDREWLNPATFLRKMRWRDRPAAAPTNGRTPPGAQKFTLAEAAAREADRAWRAANPRADP